MRTGEWAWQNPTLHTAFVQKLSCVYVCYFPHSVFMRDFSRLCLCGFVPLCPLYVPSGKAVPRILHGLFKVCDPHPLHEAALNPRGPGHIQVPNPGELLSPPAAHGLHRGKGNATTTEPALSAVTPIKTGGST